MRVMSMEQAGVKSNALEAMAFAVLAYETVRGVPANLPWVTGAKSRVVLGTGDPGAEAIGFYKVARSEQPWIFSKDCLIGYHWPRPSRALRYSW